MSKNVEIVICQKHGKDGVSYGSVSIDSYFGLNGSGMSGGAVKGEKALTYAFLLDTLRKIMGRTLTLIDSSITDKIQNKAMKDIIRAIISDEMEFSSDIVFDQKVLTEMAEEHYKNLTDEEIMGSAVTIEEALGVK